MDDSSVRPAPTSGNQERTPTESTKVTVRRAVTGRTTNDRNQGAAGCRVRGSDASSVVDSSSCLSLTRPRRVWKGQSSARSTVELSSQTVPETPAAVSPPPAAGPMPIPPAVPATQPAGGVAPTELEPATATAVNRTAVAPVVATRASVVPDPSPDDERLVNLVLQRYRTAYDRLDAQLAKAVWPSVNEAALSKAFSGLTSQALRFEPAVFRSAEAQRVQPAGASPATSPGWGRVNREPNAGSGALLSRNEKQTG